MVKLEELEDEHFVYKPETTRDGALLADDDDDFTDTGKTVPYLNFFAFTRDTISSVTHVFVVSSNSPAQLILLPVSSIT